MNTLFLDIAVVPDFKLGARLYRLHDLSDKDISRVMYTKCRESRHCTGRLDDHLQQIAAVSVMLLDGEGVRLVSSSGTGIAEQDHLQFLSTIIDQHKPEIISWNTASIFPVLNYRYLAHAMPIPLSADLAVVDLMSELREAENELVPLQDIAVLCGLPGSAALSEQEVLSASLQGSHDLIRTRLEQKIIQTCLIYQRWLLVCGDIDRATYDDTLQKIKKQLQEMDQAHLTEYVAALGSRA